MTPSDTHAEAQRVYETLRRALEEAPYAQLELLQATDQAYAFIEAEGDRLADADYLGLRMLLSQAEAILTRYFGM